MSALPETEESVDTLPALFDLLTIACDIHPTEAHARVAVRSTHPLRQLRLWRLPT